MTVAAQPGARIFVVDAFTDPPRRGNPAAVVLVAGHDARTRDASWMQAVAAELAQPATAFVHGDGDRRELRWFTPQRELGLCGHGTLAAAHALWESDAVEAPTFGTRGGTLHATRTRDGAITLDLPAARSAPEPPMRDLFAALRVEPIEFRRADGDFFLCVVADAATVRELQPDLDALRALDRVRGVYVSATGDGAPFDIVSRCFEPRLGIDEDQATGSMHCVLATFWCPRLGRDELRAYQASARGGTLTVLRRGERVLLTGRATTVLDGTLRA
jgi:PhzF family phenazine biosynthesis protein